MAGTLMALVASLVVFVAITAYKSGKSLFE